MSTSTMSKRHFLSLLLLIPSAPATAEIVKSSPAGFEITETVTIDAPAARTWDALRAIQTWWDKEHTYGGDASKLYLDAQATGCFCERLPDKGSVEHAHITFVEPGKAIRMSGALGPLATEAVTGTLSLRVDPQGSNASRVTLSYVVGGYVRAGADSLAPKVDEVLAHQLQRLKAAAEAPPPAPLPAN